MIVGMMALVTQIGIMTPILPRKVSTPRPVFTPRVISRWCGKTERELRCFEHTIKSNISKLRDEKTNS